MRAALAGYRLVTSTAICPDGVIFSSVDAADDPCHARIAGAIGGTQCAFATCFAKSLTQPLVTIVHSVTHNIEDALQVRAALFNLAASDACKPTVCQ